MKLLNDLSLINEISSGNADAINYVINKYSRLVWSVASAVLKDMASEQDIEECVADVFVSLWEHPEKFDHDRGTLKVWLSVKARSGALDKYRQLARRKDIPLEETVPTERPEGEERIIRVEDSDRLLSAVQKLEEPEREIIIRRFFYEEKPKSIAFSLGLTVKSVENHLYRAKKKLRELITK